MVPSSSLLFLLVGITSSSSRVSEPLFLRSSRVLFSWLSVCDSCSASRWYCKNNTKLSKSFLVSGGSLLSGVSAVPVHLFVFLYVVQMCLLTDAQIEELLPLVSDHVSLSLGVKHETLIWINPQFEARWSIWTLSYLYGVAGRVLQFHEPVPFILESVNVTLVGQKTVVLEILFGIKSVASHVWSSQNKTNISIGPGQTHLLVTERNFPLPTSWL